MAKTNLGEADETVKEILKAKGPGTVFLASSYPPLPLIPTGVFILDYALNGGYPEGLAFQVYGYESGGKTWLCMKAIVEFQRKYPEQVAVWIDRENTFDPHWAEMNGVDITRLFVSHPAYGEEAIDIMIAFMHTGNVGMIIVDSLPTMTSKGVTDESAEQDTMGSLARLLGKMCSHILAAWSEERKKGHRITIGLINQWRTKLGFVMGDTRTLPGGRAPQHLVTTGIGIQSKEMRGKDEYEVEVPLFNEHTFKITKSKTELAVQEGKFSFVRNDAYERAGMKFKVDEYDTVLAYAKKYGLVGGGGNKWTMTIGDVPLQRFFKNKEDIIGHLVAEPDDYAALKRTILIRSRIGRKLTPAPSDGYLVAPVPLAARQEPKGKARPRNRG